MRRAIIARLEAADEALAEIAGLRGGRLRMASFPTAGATLMPLAIATFRASYPDVELTLAEGEPEEIAPRLRTGELDLALLFEFGGQSVLQGEMLRVELLEDQLELALPRQHPLARKRSLRLSELAGEAWVQTSRSSPCAQQVLRSCHAAGFEPNVAFESDDYQTVQGLVCRGRGCGADPPARAVGGPRGHPDQGPLPRRAEQARDRGGPGGLAPGAGGAGDDGRPAGGGGPPSRRRGSRPDGREPRMTTVLGPEA